MPQYWRVRALVYTTTVGGFFRGAAPRPTTPCTILSPSLLPSDCACDTISCYSHRSFQPGMSPSHKNSFATRAALKVGSKSFEIYRLDALERSGVGKPSRLPFSLKVLLENLAAPRRRPLRSCRRYSRPRHLGSHQRRRRQRKRNLLHARSRSASGFHGRSCGRRSRRHARRNAPTSAAILRKLIRCSRPNS